MLSLGQALALGVFSNLLQVTELLSGTAGTGNQVWLLQSQGFLRWYVLPVLQSKLPHGSRQYIERVPSSQGTSITKTLQTCGTNIV